MDNLYDLLLNNGLIKDNYELLEILKGIGITQSQVEDIKDIKIDGGRLAINENEDGFEVYYQSDDKNVNIDFIIKKNMMLHDDNNPDPFKTNGPFVEPTVKNVDNIIIKESFVTDKGVYIKDGNITIESGMIRNGSTIGTAFYDNEALNILKKEGVPLYIENFKEAGLSPKFVTDNNAKIGEAFDYEEVLKATKKGMYQRYLETLITPFGNMHPYEEENAPRM